MADSIYWTLFEKFSYLPNCAYSPEGMKARRLLKINTASDRAVYSLLGAEQLNRLKQGIGPATGKPITSVVMAVSEISICRAVRDKARKQAYNDSLRDQQIEYEGVDRFGNIMRKLKPFFEIGAIVVGAVATVASYLEESPPEVISQYDQLKVKMAARGYTWTGDVLHGWVGPDGNGWNMKSLGSHEQMLYDLEINEQSGYTKFEVAYLMYRLIRKADRLNYTVGFFKDSNVIYALKAQINYDLMKGYIKSADRVNIESQFTDATLSPTVQELMEDGIAATLARPMRDSATWK